MLIKGDYIAHVICRVAYRRFEFDRFPDGARGKRIYRNPFLNSSVEGLDPVYRIRRVFNLLPHGCFITISLH